MTQTQSKQTPSLVSVDRAGRMAMRAADGAIEASRSQSSKPAPAEVASLSDDSAFAGFVFEEVGAPVSAAPTRESIPPSAKRSAEPRSESALSQEPAAGPNVVNLTGVTAAPVPKMSTRVSSMPAPAASAASKDGEDKPRGQDDRAKYPPSEGPSAASVSGRGDLELRARLNQKEAELLALRGELSARDRLLLEVNNASLGLERSRLELTEQLEQNAQLLHEAMNKIRAHEADRDATARRIEEMKLAFRRSEENWKRRNEAELDALRSEHAAELARQTDALKSKLEHLERSNAAEIAALHTAHATTDAETKEKHSEALKNLEAANNRALANAVSGYAKKVRALQEAQEKALAKVAAADAAALEAALAAAASDKSSVLAEAESAHRATQSELAATLTTVQFLERTEASRSERIAQQESKIAALEESLRRATAKADSAAETVASLRRAFGAGLSILNATPRMPEED